MNHHAFTNQDFEKFQERVEYWRGKLGLTGWHVTTQQKQIGNGVCARTSYDTTARTVLFQLTHATEGDYGMVTDINELAIHEVLHLLLAEFCEMSAKLGDSTHELVIGSEHAVVHKLMRAML